MQTVGAYSSAYEHLIFEELHQNSHGVSAVKIISVANQQGIPIYSIDSNNRAAILPKLRISDEAMADIQNALAAGKQVTVPESSIHYYDWQGDGYIIKDPNTGAAAYMIAGGLAGGSTADASDALIGALEDISKDVSFDMIGAAAKFLGMAVAEAFSKAAGYLAAAIKAITTALDMYSKTGSRWKEAAAFAVEAILYLVAGVYVTALLVALAAGSAEIGAVLIAILLVGIVCWAIETILLKFIEVVWNVIRSRWRYARKKRQVQYDYA